MKHDPADFSRAAPDSASQDDIDRRVDALQAVLPPCPGLPSAEKEIAEADARALDQPPTKSIRLLPTSLSSTRSRQEKRVIGRSPWATV